MAAPTIKDIIEHLKTTPAYKAALAKDNMTAIERMKANPLLRALSRSRS